MRGKVAEGEEAVRNPIRGSFVGCCAQAATPPKVNVIPMAISPADFRFSINAVPTFEVEFIATF
jgi:hypothetical protein